MFSCRWNWHRPVTYDHQTPRNFGCISYYKFSVGVIIFKMAMQGMRPDYLTVLREVEISLSSGDYPPFNLKPLQVRDCNNYQEGGSKARGGHIVNSQPLGGG